jgi:succinate dehydrogenase / fumarate reductase iron-sulfur subunit
MSSAEYAMQVWRGTGARGGFAEYRVPATEDLVVLDVILSIQAREVRSLAGRWNCKAGRCGSCSAEMNGRLQLMCMTG